MLVPLVDATTVPEVRTPTPVGVPLNAGLLIVGDVPKTFADIKEINTDYAYVPSTKIKIGIEKFISWYNNYKILN